LRHKTVIEKAIKYSRYLVQLILIWTIDVIGILGLIDAKGTSIILSIDAKRMSIILSEVLKTLISGI